MSLVKEFCDSFFKVKVALITDMAFVLGIASIAIDPSKVYSIQARWLALAGVVLLTLFMGCVAILWDLLIRKQSPSSQIKFPRVLRFISTNEILILEHSELLFEGALVSIFHSIAIGESRLEVPIGIGTVSHVQTDGKIVQVRAFNRIEEQQDIWALIEKDDPKILKDIVVKPSVAFSSVVEVASVVQRETLMATKDREVENG